MNQEDLLFLIGEGLGEVRFSMNEEQVKKLLGEPDSIDKEESVDEEDGTNELVVYYNYHEIGMRPAFYYYDDEFDSMNIFADQIQLRGSNLFELDQQEILDIIKKIYQEEEWEFTYDYEFFQDDENGPGEEEYNFERMGLTLWFQDEALDEVCVYKPMLKQ